MKPTLEMIESAALVLHADYDQQYSGGKIGNFLELAEAALTAALSGVDELQVESDRLRVALHRNACRYRPELTHDEINAEIERIVGGDEQREDTSPKLIHVGLDGQPHDGPRYGCTLCHCLSMLPHKQRAQ